MMLWRFNKIVWRCWRRNFLKYWGLTWTSHDYLKFSVIWSPTVSYVSREKPLVKPTAPGSLLHYICLCDLFSFDFIFRSIKPKNTKIHCCIYFIWRSIYQYLQLSHLRLPISGVVARKGLTTPLTRRVASICYLCAGAVPIALPDSPTGSINLVSSLREIPTVVVLHHPFLFGEIPT